MMKSTIQLKIHTASLLFVLLFVFSSCSEDLLPGNTPVAGNNTTAVTLNLTPTEIVSRMDGAKTSESDDNAVDNVWILQYKGAAGAADEDWKVCKAIYVSSVTNNTVTVELDSDIDQKYRIYCLANTNNNLLFNNTAGTAIAASCSTIKALKLCYKTISGSIAESEIIRSGHISLLMNGAVRYSADDAPAYNAAAPEIEITGSSPTLAVQLYRLYARINFKYDKTNYSTIRNLAVKGVQLRNVPGQLSYFDSLDDVEAGGYINYMANAVGSTDTDKVKEYTFYVPRNYLAAHTTAGSKSTHIRVVAEDAALNKRMTYDFYPHDTGNFNIEAGKTYAYTAYLDGSKPTALTTDYSVIREDIPTYTYNLLAANEASQANCYMVVTNGYETRFAFPIGGQVKKYNEFLALNAGAAVLSEGDSWTAELLWTDIPGTNAITLKTFEGSSLVSSGTATASTGRIEFELKSATTPGNAVVVVRNATTGDIVWSWHLWVLTAAPSTRTYTSWNEDSQTIPTYTIMDYNLGATQAAVLGVTSTDSRAAAIYGLLYQWGRKDPFPGTKTVALDAAGAAYVSPSVGYPSTDLTQAATLSVKNPGTFYYHISDTQCWPGSCAGYTYGTATQTNVGDNSWLYEDMKLKSLFDPCPAGWRVPDKYYLEYSASNTDTSNSQFALNKDWNFRTLTEMFNHGYDWSTLYSNQADRANQTNAKKGPGIFSAAGYRLLNNSGTFSSAGASGAYWSATPFSSSTGYSLNLYSILVAPRINSNRAYGVSVRCVAVWP